MDLLLFRHGIAQEATLGMGDFHRQLTDEGELQLTAASASLQRLGLRLSHVLHSPLVRAAQTAELLCAGLQGERVETPLLARPPGLELLEALLRASISLGEPPVVAAVGHFPYINELTALLVTGDPGLEGGFTFAPGTLAWLEGTPNPGGMQLKALMSAAHLARLRPR